MRSRRLLIASLLFALVALSSPVGAGAKISSLPVAPQAMDGSTIYGLAGSEGSEFGRFDVLTRLYSPISVPPPGNWYSWDSTVASSYGVASLVTTYTELNDQGVFTLQRISRSGALKNLMSFPGDLRGCGRELRPVEITSGGAVRATVIYQELSGRTCAIDAARTRLLEFPLKGGSKRLWLPPKYAALLYGGRIQTSGRWAVLESSVIGDEDFEGAMLLDLSRKKKVLNLNPGRRYDTLTVRLGPDGATLVTGARAGTFTTTLYSSPRARARRIATSTSRSRAFLCGRYAAVYSDYRSGVFERLTIRDMKGKQRFVLAPPAGQYLAPAICSAKYLLARDATLVRGEEEGEEIQFGEIRLISLRTGLEAP